MRRIKYIVTMLLLLIVLGALPAQAMRSRDGGWFSWMGRERRSVLLETEQNEVAVAPLLRVIPVQEEEQEGVSIVVFDGQGAVADTPLPVTPPLIPEGNIVLIGGGGANTPVARLRARLLAARQEEVELKGQIEEARRRRDELLEQQQQQRARVARALEVGGAAVDAILEIFRRNPGIFD